MVSFLESTYQDLQGTALSLHVCFKNSKNGSGSYNPMNNQLSTSWSARSTLHSNAMNAWSRASFPIPLLSMFERKNRTLLVRTMGCCTVAELDRCLVAEWNLCSIAESDRVQSQNRVSCNVWSRYLQGHRMGRADAAHRAGRAFALPLFPATKIIINNFH